MENVSWSEVAMVIATIAANIGLIILAIYIILRIIKSVVGFIIEKHWLMKIQYQERLMDYEKKLEQAEKDKQQKEADEERRD